MFHNECDGGPWVIYGDDYHGDLYVERRCHCGRLVKIGKVFVNGLGEVKLKKWVCKKHGEINPHYFR